MPTFSEQERLLARGTPAGYAWVTSKDTTAEGSEFHRWVPADHLLLLSEKLVAAATGRIKRLMVFMPPRHGKSELISKYTPAWYLGNFPHRKVMLCSYADTFAATWGRKARDQFVEHNRELFGLEVNRETSGGQSWEVAGHQGVMVTAGVGGGITGKGADLLIIDDPVKNAVEAASEAVQKAHIDWWNSTARTRLMPGGSVVLVMTRWHEGDLAGQLIRKWRDEGGDEWEILTLPGIAEESCTTAYPPAKQLDLGPDPLGRELGDALWPQMYDRLALEATRRDGGSYWFNAMYQQRPADAAGNLFQSKNFRYYTRAGQFVTLHRDESNETIDLHFCRKLMTVDAAETAKKTADYSVVSTWAVTPTKDLVLIDRQREQYEGAAVKQLVRRTFFEQGGGLAHGPSLIIVEKASAGTAILQELTNEGLPMVPFTADTDKLTRSLPAVARTEEHRVFFPLVDGGETSRWIKDEWEPELLSFPNGTNDDQVDTLSMAALQLPLMGGSGAVEAASHSSARSSSGSNLTGGLLTRRL